MSASPNGNEFAESVPEMFDNRPNGNKNRGNVPETRKMQTQKHKNVRFVSVINIVCLYLTHIMRIHKD